MSDTNILLFVSPFISSIFVASRKSAFHLLGIPVIEVDAGCYNYVLYM